MMRDKRMMAVALTVLMVSAFVLPGAAMAGNVAFSFQHFTSGGNNAGGAYDYIAVGSTTDHFDAGYEFTATQPLLVTHLGTFDYGNLAVAASMSGSTPGLDVAIYKTDGTFVASSTVVSSDTAFAAGIDQRLNGTTNSSFRYHQLASPVWLPAGNYVIISETQTAGSTFHSWVVAGGPNPQVVGYFGSIIPDGTLGVAYVGPRLRNSPGGTSSDAFFTGSLGNFAGYFGPNFIAELPEPGTISLLALGGALMLRRRTSAR